MSAGAGAGAGGHHVVSSVKMLDFLLQFFSDTANAQFKDGDVRRSRQEAIGGTSNSLDSVFLTKMRSLADEQGWDTEGDKSYDQMTKLLSSKEFRDWLVDAFRPKSGRGRSLAKFDRDQFLDMYALILLKRIFDLLPAEKCKIGGVKSLRNIMARHLVRVHRATGKDNDSLFNTLIRVFSQDLIFQELTKIFLVGKFSFDELSCTLQKVITRYCDIKLTGGVGYSEIRMVVEKLVGYIAPNRDLEKYIERLIENKSFTFSDTNILSQVLIVAYVQIDWVRDQNPSLPKPVEKEAIDLEELSSEIWQMDFYRKLLGLDEYKVQVKGFQRCFTEDAGDSTIMSWLKRNVRSLARALDGVVLSAKQRRKLQDKLGSVRKSFFRFRSVGGILKGGSLRAQWNKIKEKINQAIKNVPDGIKTYKDAVGLCEALNLNKDFDNFIAVIETESGVNFSGYDGSAGDRDKHLRQKVNQFKVLDVEDDRLEVYFNDVYLFLNRERLFQSLDNVLSYYLLIIKAHGPRIQRAAFHQVLPVTVDQVQSKFSGFKSQFKRCVSMNQLKEAESEVLKILYSDIDGYAALLCSQAGYERKKIRFSRRWKFLDVVDSYRDILDCCLARLKEPSTLSELKRAQMQFENLEESWGESGPYPDGLKAKQEGLCSFEQNPIGDVFRTLESAKEFFDRLEKRRRDRLKSVVLQVQEEICDAVLCELNRRLVAIQEKKTECDAKTSSHKSEISELNRFIITFRSQEQMKNFSSVVHYKINIRKHMKSQRCLKKKLRGLEKRHADCLDEISGLKVLLERGKDTKLQKQLLNRKRDVDIIEAEMRAVQSKVDFCQRLIDENRHHIQLLEDDIENSLIKEQSSLQRLESEVGQLASNSAWCTKELNLLQAQIECIRRNFPSQRNRSTSPFFNRAQQAEPASRAGAGAHCLDK